MEGADVHRGCRGVWMCMELHGGVSGEMHRGQIGVQRRVHVAVQRYAEVCGGTQECMEVCGDMHR